MRFLLPLPGGSADGPGFLRGFQPRSVSVRPWLPDTTRSVTWVSRVKLLRWRCAHGSAWSLFWYWDGLCMRSALPCRSWNVRSAFGAWWRVVAWRAGTSLSPRPRWISTTAVSRILRRGRSRPRVGYCSGRSPVLSWERRCCGILAARWRDRAVASACGPSCSGV